MALVASTLPKDSELHAELYDVHSDLRYSSKNISVVRNEPKRLMVADHSKRSDTKEAVKVLPAARGKAEEANSTKIGCKDMATPRGMDAELPRNNKFAVCEHKPGLRSLLAPGIHPNPESELYPIHTDGRTALGSKVVAEEHVLGYIPSHIPEEHSVDVGLGDST